MSTLKDKIHVFHDLPELKWGNALYDFFLYSALCVGIPDKLPTETEKLYYNKEKFKDIYLPQVDKSFLLRTIFLLVTKSVHVCHIAPRNHSLYNEVQTYHNHFFSIFKR